jgi:nitrate reductase NapE component
MGAVSDVDNAHKAAKNPSMIRKVFGGGSIEQEAIEAFTAKKKLEEQRYELKQFLMFTFGSKAWDDLLAMEGTIRKRRQKEVYDKQVFREKVITYVVLTVVLVVGVSVLGGFVYGLMGFDRGWW